MTAVIDHHAICADTCPNCGADDVTADLQGTVGDRDQFRCRSCGTDYEKMSKTGKVLDYYWEWVRSSG